MGIVIPRPQMRSRERRIVEAQLRRHSELMAGFQAQGVDRDEASRKAYEIVKSEKQKA